MLLQPLLGMLLPNTLSYPIPLPNRDSYNQMTYHFCLKKNLVFVVFVLLLVMGQTFSHTI